MTERYKDNNALRLGVAEATSIMVDARLETLLAHEPFHSSECERFFLALATAGQLRGRQVDMMFTGDEAWFWTLWRADKSPTNSGDYTPPPNHIGYTFPADGYNAIRIYSEVRVATHRAHFVVEWGDFHYAGKKIYRAAVECGTSNADFLSSAERMGLRVISFTTAEIDAQPMACAHALLDHFLDTAEKDGVEDTSRISPRARALLDENGWPAS